MGQVSDHVPGDGLSDEPIERGVTFSNESRGHVGRLEMTVLRMRWLVNRVGLKLLLIVEQDVRRREAYTKAASEMEIE